MPRYLYALVIALSGMSGARAANCPSGGVSIYFANGINTDLGHAVASAITLGQKIQDRLTITGNSVSRGCLSFNLAPDFEFVDSTNKVIRWADMTLQLLDAAGQKGVELTPSLLWSWINGFSVPPMWFNDIVSTFLTNSLSVFQPDLQLQVALYQIEITKGNSIIVVAHSQGNLYVNQAYTLLGVDHSALSVVAVATPTSSVPGSGPWFTLQGDVITLVPGSLPPNIANGVPSPCLVGDPVACHSFDNSYLVGDNTGPAILDAVISRIPFSNPGPVNIGVEANLDGLSWPSSGTAGVSYLVAGPQGTLIGFEVPELTQNAVAGQYKITYQTGGAPDSVLSAIAPCSTVSATTCDLTVDANQTFVFTLMFKSNPPTAGFMMASGNKVTADGATLSVAVTPGSSASVTFDSGQRSHAFNANTVTAWQWTIDGVVRSAASSFQFSLPPGSHAVSLIVTDSRGLQSKPATGTIHVTSASTNWSESTATGPLGRTGQAMAYDAARGETVVFGGAGVNGFTADTWAWNGSVWTQKSPQTSPPARSGAVMVYDSVQQRLVLYGGTAPASGVPLQETWVWDGTNWIDVTSTAGAPTAQSAFNMVFDAARGETVLYGGLCSTVFNSTCPASGGLQETWTFNGTWLKRQTSHAPFVWGGAPMIYDAARQEVVLFGGNSGGCAPHNETFIWDGSDWTQRTPTGSLPPGKTGAVMAYDSVRDRSVLFGGFTNFCFINFTTDVSTDTWEWDGASWQQAFPSFHPTAREGETMVYDLNRSQAVLFGGDAFGFPNYLNDTWLWPHP